jgi:hypothetical protein
MENNCGGSDPMLVDPAGRDFRPVAGSPLIDAGKVLPPITDGYLGDAPDIGAYEYGGERWLAGCRNALWISAPREQADGTIEISAALRMPPFEPVALKVTPGGQILKFTPDDWMNVQTVELEGHDGPARLEFFDEHLGPARISDVSTIDQRAGRVVRFDRPMLPTR